MPKLWKFLYNSSGRHCLWRLQSLADSDSDRTVTDDEIQIWYNVLKATADELPKFFQ